MPTYKFRDKSLTLRERIQSLLAELTTEEKLYMLSSNQHAAERLGIGEWHVGCEAAHASAVLRTGGNLRIYPDEISRFFTTKISLAFFLGMMYN